MYISREIGATADKMLKQGKVVLVTEACAAHPGWPYNAFDIGNAVDADHKAVKARLSAVQVSGTIGITEPFPQRRQAAHQEPQDL